MSYVYGGFTNATDPITQPNRRLSKTYTYDVVTPPTELPISLALVKQHLRLDPTDTSQDDYLTLLIKSSSGFFEKYTNRILINTQFETFFDYFVRSFELARSKLVSLDSFTYLVGGVQTAVVPAIYYNTFERNYSRIIINEWSDFPTNKDDQFQSIQVQFTAGFGATSDDMPDDIQLALLNHVAAMYESRGDCDLCDCSNLQALPVATRNTYNQYQIATLYGNTYRF